MNKRLISIVLMCVFAMPFMVQAANIDLGTPSYQVDMLNPVAAVNTKISKPVAMAKAVQHKPRVKTANTNMTLFKGKEAILITSIGNCNSCHSNAAANSIGVLGGGSIGIRRNS